MNPPRTRIATFVASVRAFVVAQPVSIAAAAVLVLLAYLSGSIAHGPSDAIRDLVGAGVTGRSPDAWLAPLASVLFAGSLPELIATVLAVLVLVGASERHIGSIRSLVAYVASGVVATVVGVTVQAIGIAVGEVWALQVAYDTTLHPFTPALGTILAASAFAGPLWRRRIRIFGFAGITTFLLYDGHPSGLYALVGALTGLWLGRLMRPRKLRVAHAWTKSSHHEARVLLSALVAVTALGPVVTLLTRAPIGILAPLGELFRGVLPERRLPALCRLVLHHSELTGAAAHRLVSGASGPLPSTALCSRDLAVGSLHGPGTVVLSLMPLVMLLVSAAFIRRGRRIAVWAAVCVNALLAGLSAFFYGVLPFATDSLDTLPGHHVERTLLAGLSVVVPLSVAVVLVAFRHHFTVRARSIVVVQYVWALAGSFVTLATFFVATGYIGRNRFAPVTDLRHLLVSAPERFVPIGFLGAGRLGPVPRDALLRVVFQGIGPVFWLIAIAGLVLASSAAAARSGGGAGRRAALDRILKRGAAGSLSHMATWDGNSWWFTPDDRAAVAYRVVGGTAITTGEPLCEPDRTAEVVLAFGRWCDDRGLVPVFYSVRDELAPIFADLGWSTLPVGEETVLHPATFAMRGKKWQDVRSSINRADKCGVRAITTTFTALRPTHARQIEEISEQWVADKDLPEMGFTLGGLDELGGRGVTLVLAIDGDDRVVAVTSWLPTYRDGVVVGRTLDFMRRRPDSMNGVMEFVIASAALDARERGLEFLSLSAAPLASSPDAYDTSDTGQAQRVLGFVARALEPAYGFQSLLAFKKKFQPEFVPLIMAYPDPLALPAIGAALGRAYLPDLSVRQVPRLIRSGR